MTPASLRGVATGPEILPTIRDTFVPTAGRQQDQGYAAGRLVCGADEIQCAADRAT
jgi:hypothetical protein